MTLARVAHKGFALTLKLNSNLKFWTPPIFGDKTNMPTHKCLYLKLMINGGGFLLYFLKAYDPHIDSYMCIKF